jgi:AbrB family looped-hinge helix DNA binding protein
MTVVQTRRKPAPVTVSKKGWVVIPKEIRQKYGIQPGDKIYIFDAGGRIALMKAHEDPIAFGRGFLKGGPSLAMEMVKEHREEVEREEREIEESRKRLRK